MSASARSRVRVVLLLIGPLVLLSAAPAQARFDACSLITRAEIEAVQGERVTDTRSSAPDRSDLPVAQCFYTVATFAKSVSLEVTRKDPRSPASEGPLDRWTRIFHGARENDEPAPAGEPEGGHPLLVEGVGDEAFWMGNSISGGLYVLMNESYLRISIGGSEGVPDKIKKAKLLARKALPRL